MTRKFKKKITIEDLSEDLSLRKEYFKIEEKYPNEMGEMLDFFIDLLILRGRSLNTTKTYYKDLCTFYDFIITFYPNITKLEDIKRIHVNKYFMYCQSQRKNGNTTLERKEKTLNLFFRVLEEQGALETGASPLAKKDSLKRLSSKNKKLPIYLEDHEMKELFETINKEKNDFLRLRDYTMVAIFYYTGLRASELISLNLNDIDKAIKSLKLTVVGKGNKERPIPVLKHFFSLGHLKYLQKYLEIRKLYVTSDTPEEDKEALFLGRDSNRITLSGIEKRLFHYIKKTSIKKNVTPHKLRHTFATKVYKETNNIVAVQQLLGHASVATTQIYAHVDDQQKIESIEAAFSFNGLAEEYERQMISTEKDENNNGDIIEQAKKLLESLDPNLAKLFSEKIAN